MIIRNAKDFVDWLTDFVANTFPGPRLKNPNARLQERNAAQRLCDAGYKASRVKAVWLFAQDHNFFSSKINSVQALASALLDPPNPNWLEADYDVWAKAHPAICKHGRLVENKAMCPGCNADPDCKQCYKGDGIVTARVTDILDLQFVCDCAAAKMGLPTLEERIKIQREILEKRQTKILRESEADEVL
jgi:hypothetical protein